MDTNEITIEILKNIRDEIHEVRGELRGGLQDVRDELRGGLQDVRDEIRDTNRRLDSLERRQVESEVRLSTEVVALAGVVREVRDVLRDDRVSRVRVDDHEARITALEKREA